MNRYKFTAALKEVLRTEIKQGKHYHPLLLKHKGTTQGANVFLDGRKVVLPDEVDQVLQQETERPRVAKRLVAHELAGRHE